MNNTHKLIGISGVNKYNAITGVDNSLEKSCTADVSL